MIFDSLNREQIGLLDEISDASVFKGDGAYNLRLDGHGVMRHNTDRINIVPRNDGQGIEVYVKPGTVGETVHIPVIISESGLKETVFNDFYIGEGCDVTVIAGCGIHNAGDLESMHSGVHSFSVGKNARVKYIEKHIGTGGRGKRSMNPTTSVMIEEGGFMEMNTVQIKGVDNASRMTRAVVKKGGTLVITEKIMTDGEQTAGTEFTVDLDGEDSCARVVSRSVARGRSKQLFVSDVRGNSRCSARTECDAIVMDEAGVSAIPKISANVPEASLVHEAAIGKIAGEQLVKLMTLGLTEKEAEEEIINGFLK
ncbi:MAG: SufD family Fe-S cluster assembly protein [Clostridia bacterium]|nr:SufD family Fe-S cluster assembly protein [Clostridia bacterium]